MKTKIIKFIKRHRKSIFLTGVILILAVSVLPHMAFAQAAAGGAPPAAGTPPTTTPEIQKMQENILNGAQMVMNLLNVILWPVLLLIGGLMKSDLLYGAGMEDKLLTIWGAMRDLVNILFVLILLGIAFYGVMGGSNNEFQIKTVLPKFVIALILVNFSFVGLKVVLDGVNVVTTAIFALPATTTEEKGKIPITDEFQKQVCSGLYGDPVSNEAKYKLAVQEAGESRFCALDTTATTFTDKAKQFFNRFDSNNAAIVMAVNLANVTDLKTVYTKQKLQFSDLTLNVLFSLIFYIIYAVAFVCLMIVLIARLVALYLSIILSPFMALAFVLPKSIMGNVSGDTDIKDMFVQNAIVPIPIALVMTIGFVMIQGFKAANFNVLSFNSPGAGANMLVSGTTTLQDIIAGVAMVAFLWKGIFAAMDKSMAKGVTGKIKSTVQGTAEFIGGSWKYLPIFPVQAGKGEGEKPSMISVAGLEQVQGRLSQGLQTQASDQAAIVAKGVFGMEGGTYPDSIRKAKSVEDLRKTLRDAHDRNMGGEKEVQQALGTWSKQNPRGGFDSLQVHFTPGQYKDKDKKPIQTWLDFKKKMESGDVDKDDMAEFTRKATEKVQLERPPVAGQEPGAGTAAAAAAAGAAGVTAAAGPTAQQGESEQDAAEGILAGSDPYTRSDMLDKAEKEAVKKYKDASGDAKEKAAKDPKFQSALKKLKEAEEKATATASAISFAASDDDIQSIVDTRKKQLKEAGITDEKVQDEIIRSEIAKSPQAAQNVRKNGNAKQKEKYAPEPAAAPAPVPASPAAPAAPTAPAPSAPPATPTQTPAPAAPAPATPPAPAAPTAPPAAQPPSATPSAPSTPSKP